VRLARGDDGLGLIEVVITLFLLSLVALSFLPFLLNSYVAARDNAARGAANSLVADALGRLRSELITADHDCDWVESWALTNSVLVDVEGGADVQLNGTVADCPAEGPGAATVTFVGSSAADGTELVSAATKVYVTG
jgi:Tfp pilus assembly protein PilV